MNFKSGDKVIVEGDWNFPKTCSGTISEPPDTVVNLAEDSQPWAGIQRLIKGRKKLLRYYWVKFDEPQYDSDDDGPYYGGEVEDMYIKLKK
jgi:hypothetical protein